MTLRVLWPSNSAVQCNQRPESRDSGRQDEWNRSRFGDCPLGFGIRAGPSQNTTPFGLVCPMRCISSPATTTARIPTSSTLDLTGTPSPSSLPPHIPPTHYSFIASKVYITYAYSRVVVFGNVQINWSNGPTQTIIAWLYSSKGEIVPSPFRARYNAIRSEMEISTDSDGSRGVAPG
ncbi:hypothetical protein BDN72DRAFT_388733 [Pluteus cervinus]|uniref:Uncharacterized protein n=1 Tax=Pluteus cervinus TaxID=181527 RepID=A0ACD3B221_9AGAR|nr:hypothetical protein BDN72DRAFT_388733 [Pluteus cervinus]